MTVHLEHLIFDVTRMTLIHDSILFGFCHSPVIRSDGIIQNGHGVTMPKEQSLEPGPHLRVAPMLAQDICWVDLARDILEAHHT